MASNIIIADDHPLIRFGFAEIIKTDPYLDVKASASDSEELMQHLKKEVYDLLILDYNMPYKDCIDLINLIKSFYEDIKIIILSVNTSEEIIYRTYKAKADAYINKTCSDSELINTIHSVLNGEKVFPDFIEDRIKDMSEKKINKTNSLHQLLTEREFQIFLKLASGIKVSKVADILNISVKTVSTHRASILKKIQVSDNMELIKYALDNNINLDAN